MRSPFNKPPIRQREFSSGNSFVGYISVATANGLKGMANQNPSNQIPQELRSFSAAAKMPPDPETPQASPEAIALLEQAAIPAEAKCSLLLASLGVKPVGLTHLQSDVWYDNKQPQDIDDVDYSDTVALIRELGLHVHALDRIAGVTDGNETTWQRTRLLTASYSSELLDMVDTALTQQSSEDHQILGQAFGYPVSATHSYIWGRGVAPSTVTDDPELLAFGTYAVSIDGYEEELETARFWASKVLAASPAIYYERMAEVQS